MWIEKNLGEECIEYIVSMMMEPYDDIVNPLVNKMSAEEEKYFNIPTHRTVIELKKNIGKKLFRNVKNKFFPKKK